MKTLRNFPIWLFYYLLGVVPINIALSEIDFVYSYPSEAYVLLNSALFGLITFGLIATWYMIADVLEEIHIQRLGSKEAEC